MEYALRAEFLNAKICCLTPFCEAAKLPLFMLQLWATVKNELKANKIKVGKIEMCLWVVAYV